MFFSNGERSIIRRAICWFTRGPHYHVGIAFWVNAGGQRRLMLAESQPDGFRIINLSFYADREMTVFDCPVAWEKIQDQVVGSAGGIEYNFYNLALIGLHERFGLPVSQDNNGISNVCSGVVAKILNGGGLSLPTLISPQRLYELFIGCGFASKISQ